MVLFSFLTALCTGALAMGVPATPIVVRDAAITLPLARRFNATGTRNVLTHDQARAKALKMRSSQEQRPGGVNLPVEDFITTYTADVLIGTPPTSYSLLVDTGSANTWVGAGKAYAKTSSSVDTGESVFVAYGSGLFFGEEFTDTVKIGPLTIHNQSIGAAKVAFGFPPGIDGILGCASHLITSTAQTWADFGALGFSSQHPRRWLVSVTTYVAAPMSNY